MRFPALFTALLIVSLLAACGSPTPRTVRFGGTIAQPLPVSEKGNEVALYALGLIDTGYRFGGKNPEAGLDCSGMVSFIYGQAAGLKVKGSAADIARSSRPIDPEFLRPGALGFFEVRKQRYFQNANLLSDSRFVHAPATNGRVRIDRLNDRYYTQRYEAARTFFD